jgi:hypothetical protein
MYRRRREVIRSNGPSEVSGNVLRAKLRHKNLLVKEETFLPTSWFVKLHENRVLLRASSKILTKTTSPMRYCHKNYIHYTLLSLQLHSLHVTVTAVTFITRYRHDSYIHYTLLSLQLHSLHVTVTAVTFITRYRHCSYIHYTLASLQLHSLHVTVTTVTFITRYCGNN